MLNETFSVIFKYREHTQIFGDNMHMITAHKKVISYQAHTLFFLFFHKSDKSILNSSQSSMAGPPGENLGVPKLWMGVKFWKHEKSTKATKLCIKIV